MSTSITKKCNVTNCDDKSKSLGFCPMHYSRYKKYGNPLAEVRAFEKHGMTGTYIYRAWQGMRNRCYKPNHFDYKNYGGRGIDVCDEWQKSFSAFYADMGDRPSKKHSIDRIDNDKGYSPENCRWATTKEQSINKRIRKDNKCGYRGVYFNKAAKKWFGYSHKSGKKYVGGFENPKDAHKAILKYDLELRQ